jgi:hypothetical protein
MEMTRLGEPVTRASSAKRSGGGRTGFGITLPRARTLDGKKDSASSLKATTDVASGYSQRRSISFSGPIGLVRGSQCSQANTGVGVPIVASNTRMLVECMNETTASGRNWRKAFLSLSVTGNRRGRLKALLLGLS